MHRYRKNAQDSFDTPASSASLASPAPRPPRPVRAQTFSGQEQAATYTPSYDPYSVSTSFSVPFQSSTDLKRPQSGRPYTLSQSPYVPVSAPAVPPLPYGVKPASAPVAQSRQTSTPSSSFQSPAYQSYTLQESSNYSPPYPVYGGSASQANSFNSTYNQQSLGPSGSAPEIPLSYSSDYTPFQFGKRASLSAQGRPQTYDIAEESDDGKYSLAEARTYEPPQDDYTALSEALKLPGTELGDTGADDEGSPGRAGSYRLSLPGSSESEDKKPVIADDLQHRPPATPPPGSTVRALWDFEATEPGELAFTTGDEIEVLESMYRSWWKGTLRGETGIFPSNYVQVVKSKRPEAASRKTSNSSLVPSIFERTKADHDATAVGGTTGPTPPRSPPASMLNRRMSQDAEKEAYEAPPLVEHLKPLPMKAEGTTVHIHPASYSAQDWIDMTPTNTNINTGIAMPHRPRFSFMNLFPWWRHKYEKNETSTTHIEAAIDNANASFWSRTRQYGTAVVADFALKMSSSVTADLNATTHVNTYNDDKAFRSAITSPLFMGFRVVYVLDNQQLAETAISHYFATALTDHSWKRFQTWARHILPAKLTLRKASRFARLVGNKLRRDFACGFEHNDRFSTSLTSDDLSSLLDVAKAAHDCGAYHRCMFNTVSQTPRHAVYFCHDDNKDQRTLIIVHSRPLHFVSLDHFPRSWASEDIWRGLQDDFPQTAAPTSHDQVMFLLLRVVMTKVAEEVVQTWMAKVEDLQTQFGHLESAIYTDPASNDDLSTDLWKLSKYLLETRELMGHHVGTIQWIERTVNQMASLQGEKTMNPDAQLFWQAVMNENWLRDQMTEMDEMAQSIEENLKEPIDKTLDLMYKSISIRDARLSLELNASLWRLSWITFIFLPLTFLVGFFGMNVDVFRTDPSIKWYFVTAVPFMCLVFLFWLVFKKALSHRYDNRRRKMERDALMTKKTM